MRMAIIAGACSPQGEAVRGILRPWADLPIAANAPISAVASLPPGGRIPPMPVIRS